MKTKTLVLIGIALCTMLLISQALASGIDTLEIYGNANEDDTIDMRDLTYVKLIFFGKKPETELADAKYDGKINPLDFIQIKLIIVGKEKELTIIDAEENIVTVNKPVKRIIVFNPTIAEAIQVLNVIDKVVGVGTFTQKRTVEFPEFSKLPSVGTKDYEAMLNLNPDLVIGVGIFGVDHYRKHLPDNIAVMGLDTVWVGDMRKELTKLGYVLDREDEAKEFFDFYEGYMDILKGRTEGFSEDDRPRAYYSYGKNSFYTTRVGFTEVETAGGRNVADDLTKDNWGSWWGISGWFPTVDPEWVIDLNPDFIFSRFSASGGYVSDDLSGMKDLREYIMNLPELAYVNAVKNGKVYAIHYDIVTGPGAFISVLYYAKLFNPDIFEDLDVQMIHQEYVDRFKRIDYNVYEHGVFVYPPLED